MYASPFEYVRVESWGDAVERLAEAGEDARPIAGGQSLAPMMMLRIAEPPVLVDIGHAGPRAIERVDGTVSISALARHVDLEQSPEVRTAFPALAEAAGRIGNVRVRHRGTIGGSLAHSDPAAELPCVAVAASAAITALGAGGERTIPAAELFVGHFTTSLEPGELITQVAFPALRPGQGCAFAELSRRPGDFATVEACAVAELSADGSWADGRLVAGALGDRPLDLSAALEPLRGERPTDALLAEVAHVAAERVEPGPSSHGSPGYRRHMLAVIARRTLAAALERAGERRA